MEKWGNGMITPPGTGILNYLFPLLTKNHIKGFTIYGNVPWSNAAMTNYIDAKMLWNPQLNANDLQREWLTRAYGPQAGAVMEDFYTKLDEWFDAFYNKYDSYSYYAYESLFSHLFAPHYAEMEQLFLQAEKQPMTPEQKARFDLLKDNLIILRWRLANAGYIKANVESPYKRDGAQIAKMMFNGSDPTMTEDKSFDLFPVLWYSDQPHQEMLKVNLGAAPAESSTKIPDAGYILLYAKQAGEINLKASDVDAGSAFVGWTLYEPKDQNDFRQAQKGLFYDGVTINFAAKANTLYMIRITTQGLISPKLNYTLTIPNATATNGQYADGTLYLKDTKSPFLVIVPKGLDVYADNTDAGARLRTLTPPDAARAAELNAHPGAKVLLSLDTGWKFQTDPQKVGLAQKYFSIDYDHQSWKTLNATATWQDQGFPNYHGVAWYRKTLTLKTKPSGKVLLFFGAVDGDAVIYVNGEKVGEHSLEKDGAGWDQPFEMDITSQLKTGKNAIAVQVTKNSNASGIYKGVALLGMAD
jgi:hypothetical protein